MSQSKLPARRAVYLLFIVASLSVGWLIPDYYDWTGANQSRPAPVIAQTAGGLILAAVVVWLSLPWLPVAAHTHKEGRNESLRFSVRSLLMVTSVVAVGIALLLKFPSAVAGAFCVMVFGYTIWSGIARVRRRLPTAALLACLMLPYVWVIADDVLSRKLSVIFRMALSMPSLLPIALIGSVAGQNLHDLEWLAMLLTGVELLFGVWMIRIGPKLTIAYLIVVWLLSTFGSFGLNALARM